MIQIIDKIKLLFRKDKALYNDLYAILGFYPHNIGYYKTAFTHRSNNQRLQLRRRSRKDDYASREEAKPVDNERLEFLGDAVLETVVSEILYHRYPRKKEGFLTSTRSKLVARETLGKLAKELKLERFMKLPKNGGQRNSYIGGNAFEALVGAIFLDRGYHYAYHFIKHLIKKQIVDLDSTAKKEVNFKSRLLEYCQKNRIHYHFENECLQEDRQAAPAFTSKVIIEEVLAGEGNGSSKKESEQHAAKSALVRMRREKGLIDKILRSKEQRTAMEAPEFGALPKIREIEEEVRRLNKLEQEQKDKKAETSKVERTPRKAERPVKARERKAAQQVRETREAEQLRENASDKEKNCLPAASPVTTSASPATTSASQEVLSKERATAAAKTTASAKKLATLPTDQQQKEAEPVAAPKKQPAAKEYKESGKAQSVVPVEVDIVGETLSPVADARLTDFPTTDGKAVTEKNEERKKAMAPSKTTSSAAQNKPAVAALVAALKGASVTEQEIKPSVAKQEIKPSVAKQEVKSSVAKQEVKSSVAGQSVSSSPVSAAPEVPAPPCTEEPLSTLSLEAVFAQKRGAIEGKKAVEREQKARQEEEKNTVAASQKTTLSAHSEEETLNTTMSAAPTLSVADLVSQLAAKQPQQAVASESGAAKSSESRSLPPASKQEEQGGQRPAIADLVSALSAGATAPQKEATTKSQPAREEKPQQERQEKPQQSKHKDTRSLPAKEESVTTASRTEQTNDASKRRRKKAKPEPTAAEAAAELAAIKAAALREIQASNGRMYER